MKFDFSCWKMYVKCTTMHEFFFLFVLFKECIYECMKCDFFLKERMLKYMKFVWIWIFWFCSFWKMYIRMHEIWFFCLMHLWIHEKKFYWIWILKMHVWMHEIWFFVLFFLNGAFMKEWNFLLNLNFEFKWKCMFEYIKFDFFVFE